MKKQERTIVKRKIWTFEEIEYSGGIRRLNRVNDGFTFNELLGLLYRTQIDLIEQLKGENVPDVVKRTVIQD